MISQEMGKPVAEARAEIDKCALTCEYFAQHAGRFLANQPLEVAQGEAFVHYEPLGIVLAVMPWNFPFWQVVRFAAPGLMAGNAALLKHAPNVPRCAEALAGLFHEAGLPTGLFQQVRLNNQQVATLIGHRAVKAVTLTGSERAGSAVAATAGQHIKKTVLELGGSDPFIVLGPINIDDVAREAVLGRMINGGQSCIAAKRFFVVEALYGEFLAAFTSHMAALKTGNPLHEATQYGPLARTDLADTLRRQVEASVAAGAKVHYQAAPQRQVPAYYPPTILTHVQAGMPAFEEELFGPVATVLPVPNAEAAIALANQSKYGLGASVWCTDVARAKAVALQIDSGAVFVNARTASAPAVPFGGIKYSGYGKELAEPGIKEFVNAKSIVVGG